MSTCFKTYILLGLKLSLLLYLLNKVKQYIFVRKVIFCHESVCFLFVVKMALDIFSIQPKWLSVWITVMARKIYMEGIYKQASDSRYWDLWNRQKLNSELELKRQHILSLNQVLWVIICQYSVAYVLTTSSQSLFQDLTNQLIELERHFNALELNKFSQNGGRCIGHGPSQNRYGPSRYNNL